MSTTAVLDIPEELVELEEGTKIQFEWYVLEAFLGGFTNAYDTDFLLDKLTYIDYKDGNRYWLDYSDPIWETANINALLDEASTRSADKYFEQLQQPVPPLSDEYCAALEAATVY